MNLRSALAALAFGAGAFALITSLERAGVIATFPLQTTVASLGGGDFGYRMIFIVSLFAYLIPILVSSGQLSSRLRIKEAELLRANRNLSSLYHLNQSLAGTLEIPRILVTAMNGVKEHFGFKRVNLLLVGKDGQFVEIVDSEGAGAEADHDVWQERLRRVAATKEPRLEPGRLTLPLLSKGNVIGAMLLEFASGESGPEEEELQTLVSLANQLAIFIENARLYQETEQLARLDDLTQLFNRRHFEERLAEEIKRADRRDGAVSLLLTDIDHFKKVNDGYGHREGDRILRDLGSVIRSTLREIDLPARYGGDEFAVILPETAVRAAREVAERLRRAVAAHVFFLNEIPIRLTVSIGIATRTPKNPTVTPDYLLQMADNALYRAKARGGNRLSALEDEQPDLLGSSGKSGSPPNLK
ncbi:MAG: GGDEF domain-containing protein [Vicinamibacteria bacterium]